jgi:hypothetical protein
MFDWPTFAFNNQRTGESPDTTITKNNVQSLTVGWQKTHLGNSDFNVQTQPIVATGVQNVSIDGKTHNIVYVGGGSGTFYAFDAYTGAYLWSRYLGSGTYTCDAQATFGIQGTPALDKANGAIYVPDGLHRVHALDLASGKELAGWPVDLVAPGTDNGSPGDLHEFAHTALTLRGGELYAGTSSTCDITPWQGRLAMIDVGSRALARTFYTVYNQGAAFSGGGIWGWGGASSDGNAMYIGVGNTDTAPQSGGFVQAGDEANAYGEHVVRLSTDLSSVQGANAPSLALNPPPTDPGAAEDLDLSGTPMLFQPSGCSDPLLAVQGKSGYLLIYKRNNLGAGPIASFQFSWSAGYAHYTGVPAYSAQTGYLYASVPTSISTTGSVAPGMAIVHTAGCSFWVAANPQFGPDSFQLGVQIAPPPAEPPALPRSTVTIANGVAFMGTPNGVLYAVDASSGNRLWDSSGLWSANSASDQIRFGPVVTGGWVYLVEAESGTLWALKVDAAATSSSLRRTLSLSRPLPAPTVIRRMVRHH